MTKKFTIEENTGKTTSAMKKISTMTESTEEYKTARVQLAIKPSVLDSMKKLSVMEGTNFNALINEFCESYIKKNQAKLEQYTAIFGNKLPKENRGHKAK